MKKLFMLLACVALLLFVASCVSAPSPKPPEKPKEEPVVVKPEPPKEEPKPVPEPKKEEPVVKVEEPAPDAQKAKASELKKRAFDLKLNDVLPTEYKAADQANAKGLDEYGKNNLASKTAFEESVKLFTEVIDKGLPLLASGKKQRAESTKAASVKAKADEDFPALFSFADTSFSEGEAFTASAKYEEAAASYDEASLLYGILIKIVNAKEKKDLIQLWNYSIYETGNFTIAEQKYAQSTEIFESDPSNSLLAVDEAIIRYQMVLNMGRELGSRSKLAVAVDAKSKADEVKADVAVKDGYAEAEKALAEAKANQAEGNIEKALELYDLANEKFAQVYALAVEKRDTAQWSFDNLQLKKEDSLSKIVDADTVSQQLEGMKE